MHPIAMAVSLMMAMIACLTQTPAPMDANVMTRMSDVQARMWVTRLFIRSP